MVTKMNEPAAATVVESLNSQQATANPATITITLHSQPSSQYDEVDEVEDDEKEQDEKKFCDYNSAELCDDSESIKNSQQMAKRSLKLDLNTSNIHDISSEVSEKEDLSFKSSTSPKSPKSEFLLVLGKISFLLKFFYFTSIKFEFHIKHR